ncbi:MAG: class I SAM-dependent methyltransferase [Candidatus Uhrbacteria bacterium]
MPATAYKEPLYYEIAFGFVNSKKQCDLFEKYIEKYSRTKVNKVLDIGCGPSLQLRELAERGYDAIGLDNSSQMLRYLREQDQRIKTVKADMNKFILPQKVDFAFNMMGTISYCDLLPHLDSLARSLNKGGLYLIENFRLDWSDNLFKPQSWTMKQDGIKVKTSYSISVQDYLNQLLDERMEMQVDDHGQIKTLNERTTTKMIFPQELLGLIKQNGKFEFIDWFERDKIKKLTKASNENVILLRRK